MNKNKTSIDLYRDARALIDELDERDGITDEDLDTRLEEFLGGSEDKLDRHRYAIDYFKSEEAMIRKEVQRLQARARSLKNTADRIKGHARLVLEARVELMGYDEGRKITTSLGSVYLSTRESLNILDEDQIEDVARNTAFVSYVPKLDKAAIKKAVKDGSFDFKGLAVLESKVSITFK
jgi:hypothetical protein